jgi:hypothetical protein
VGLCPFHDDHEPSLVVDAKKQLWNCLGACREGGDVYRFVMKADGVDFREAHRRPRKVYKSHEFSGGPSELFAFVESAAANPTLYSDLT